MPPISTPITIYPQRVYTCCQRHQGCGRTQTRRAQVGKSSSKPLPNKALQ
jgi:hypothetical protein